MTYFILYHTLPSFMFQKSLPLLRQSLVTKELVIEGINPPAPHVAFSTIPTPSQQVLTGSNVQLVSFMLMTT